MIFLIAAIIIISMVCAFVALALRQQRSINRQLTAKMNALNEETESLREEKEQLAIAGRINRSRHQRIETALRSIPDPLIVSDAVGRMVLANAPAEKMFAFELPPGSSNTLGDCIKDELFLEILQSARQSHNPREIEFSHTNGDGQKWFNVLVSQVIDIEQDKTRGLVAILRDITREREAAKMKTDFVASAAHELRTPLGSIKAYLEMLADGEVEDKETRDKFYGVMQDELSRLGNLIENILNISRIEAGIVKIAKEPVPLTVLVKEVLDVIRPKAEADGYKLIEDLVPVFFHIHADKEMIKQAVLNLISNALKYTPKGGSVTVKMIVDEAAGNVTTEVIDTGVGISEKDLPQMFNKFFRTSNGKQMAKGTGLGLVLVKEIVETVHSGKIGLKSEVGKGSTFSFTLPLVKERENGK